MPKATVSDVEADPGEYLTAPPSVKVVASCRRVVAFRSETIIPNSCSFVVLEHPVDVLLPVSMGPGNERLTCSELLFDQGVFSF